MLRAARGLSTARGSAEAAALALAVFVRRFINVKAKSMTVCARFGRHCANLRAAQCPKAVGI
jgi:hypothetical protein